MATSVISENRGSSKRFAFLAIAVLATPSADVGSVGVFTCHVDFSQQNQNVGIVVTYIASSPEKVELNPDEPLADDALAFVQAGVDRVYTQFLADIAAGRGLSASRVRLTFGNGRSFGAADALARGMVDGVKTLDRLLASAPAGRVSGRQALAASETDAVQADHAAILAALS